MLREFESIGEVPKQPSTIGYRMKLARARAQAQQRDLIKALEVSRQTVYDWESDRRRPPKVAIFAWAWLTGCDFEWLWTGKASEGTESTLEVNRAMTSAARSRKRSSPPGSDTALAA